MRVYTYLDGVESELEDVFFTQFLEIDSPVYLDNKKYKVKDIRKDLYKSGENLDAVLRIYLE